jgi:hypothetical protein
MKKLTIIGSALLTGLLLSVGAKAQVIYEDNFGAGTPNSGQIQGSTPDTDDYQNGVWTNGPYFATSSLVYNSGIVSVVPGSYNFVDAFLPVNSSAAYAGETFNNAPTTGRSGGPAIDGTVGFTETAVVTATSDTTIALSLFNGTPYDSGFGGLATSDGSSFATLQVGGYIYTDVNGSSTFDFGDSALGGPVTLSMVYDPSALTLILSSTLPGSSTPFTQVVPVTESEIAGLTGVGFNLSTNSGVADGTVSQFTFSETESPAVPEPSTWGMLFIGLGMLAFCIRRKAALSK